jgi:uncharacterized protein YyaL (SSP411 family)
MANRLASEKSPYLLQHAENPVDWYPWSDEAFDRAAQEDKPVFLSVGYSTCHWCHVMERESFEDAEVAQLLNDTFICIKVDREERPDIDAVYMTACSMMTGSGGWPLTVVMTPDRKPFFAGTYFPKNSSYGRTGLLELVPRIRDIWLHRRNEILHSIENIIENLQLQHRSAPGTELDTKIMHQAFADLAERYDSENGGFSSAPKFPTPHIITFLLRYRNMTGREEPLTMAEQTLTAMRLGGIFDHVGFGFHRYSTDAKWLLPHFEKMLYDQALLADAYLEAYQSTAKHLYRQTADEIFSYVLRDMTAPAGGFYSAEDADSEGVEGKFYVWSLGELQEALAPEETEFIRDLYGIMPGGNFREEATGEETGTNILHLASLPRFFMVHAGQAPEELLVAHERIRHKLFSRREKRIHPHKDDKILTDWNGLMIGALARGARILGRKTYLEAALKCSRFILAELSSNGRLLHRYREGEAALAGMLCDYAYFVWGLLEVYGACFDTDILEKAILLNEQMLRLFWDEKDGGFFLTPTGGEALPVRPKEIYDGALPSGNSVALENLLRLERLTGNPDLGTVAKQLVRAFSKALQEVPSGYTRFLSGFHAALTPQTEVVIVGRPGAQDTLKMLAVLQKNTGPHLVALLKDPDAEPQILDSLAPFTAAHTAIDNRATAYVCRNHSCASPTTDPQRLEDLLREQLSGPA